MLSPRIGIALTRRNDLQRGPNGGTFRARRKAERIDETGVRWLVARVMTGQEFAIADDLAAAGFRAYAPHGVRVNWQAAKGKKCRRERDYAIFAGYVFVGCPDGLLLGKLSHEGIIEVLGEILERANEPSVLRALNDLHLSGIWDDRQAPPLTGPVLKTGDMVQVMEGPFASFLAIVRKLPSAVRASIDVNIFGRTTKLDIDTRQLRAM